MLLTFAELQFLVSWCDLEPELPLLDLLEEPVRDIDQVAAAGLSSLVARSFCSEHLDDEGYVTRVDFCEELAQVHAAVNSAVTSIRITTVSPERSTYWLLLVGPRRVALSPVATGVFAAVVVPHDSDLRQQVTSLVNSALIDDPHAGVAITRGGNIDAMSFRTNDEFGGPVASDGQRRPVIEALVDTIFVNHHPSMG
jgi:hypothetical protein